MSRSMTLFFLWAEEANVSPSFRCVLCETCAHLLRRDAFNQFEIMFDKKRFNPINRLKWLWKLDGVRLTEWRHITSNQRLCFAMIEVELSSRKLSIASSRREISLSWLINIFIFTFFIPYIFYIFTLFPRNAVLPCRRWELLVIVFCSFLFVDWRTILSASPHSFWTEPQENYSYWPS